MAHCGGNMAGSFIQSLTVTDAATGWVEAVPLLAREQTLVVEALGVIAARMPIPVLGIVSDNDCVLISQTVSNYCRRRSSAPSMAGPLATHRNPRCDAVPMGRVSPRPFSGINMGGSLSVVAWVSLHPTP